MNILCSDIKYKFEKLEYLREIQRLKSAITCYQESENFAGKDVSLNNSLHPNQCTYRNSQGGNGRIISHASSYYSTFSQSSPLTERPLQHSRLSALGNLLTF